MFHKLLFLFLSTHFLTLFSIGYNDAKVVLTVIKSISEATAEATNKDDSQEHTRKTELTLDTSQQRLGVDRWYLDDRGMHLDRMSLISTESDSEEDVRPKDELTVGRFSPVHMIAEEGDSKEWTTRSTAQVEICTIDITLIDDFKKQDQPIALLSSSLFLSAKNFMSTTRPLDVWATLSLCLAFYNPRVSTWEPIIEAIVDESTHIPDAWELRAHVRMRQGSEGRITSTMSQPEVTPDYTCIHPDALPDLLCIISAKDRLEINFSNAFYSTLTSSVFLAGEENCNKDDADVISNQAVSILQEDERTDTVMIKREFVEYLFSNTTGHPLRVTLHNPNQRITDTREVQLSICFAFLR